MLNVCLNERFEEKVPPEKGFCHRHKILASMSLEFEDHTMGAAWNAAERVQEDMSCRAGQKLELEVVSPPFTWDS